MEADVLGVNDTLYDTKICCTVFPCIKFLTFNTSTNGCDLGAVLKSFLHTKFLISFSSFSNSNIGS